MRSCAAAARVGLAGALPDPWTGRPVAAWELVDRLVAAVRPQLLAHDDEALVVAALARLRVTGGGAQRQRRLFAAASSPPAFVASLARSTTADLAAAGVVAMSAIVIDGLVKDFGPRTRALDQLDLEVAAGEVHGFLGPNGAGKTTTIRVLLGMLRADAGHVALLGGDPWRDAVACTAAWPTCRAR